MEFFFIKEKYAFEEVELECVVREWFTKMAFVVETSDVFWFCNEYFVFFEFSSGWHNCRNDNCRGLLVFFIVVVDASWCPFVKWVLLVFSAGDDAADDEADAESADTADDHEEDEIF